MREEPSGESRVVSDNHNARTAICGTDISGSRTAATSRIGYTPDGNGTAPACFTAAAVATCLSVVAATATCVIRRASRYPVTRSAYATSTAKRSCGTFAAA